MKVAWRYAAICLLLTATGLFSRVPTTAQKDTESARSQSTDPEVEAQRTFRVDVDLVLVNVTVTDPYNRLVTGLESQHFKIFEDKEPQEILYFSGEDVPISLGVIFDISGSMGQAGKLKRARQAVVEFFRTANPSDEFFVVTFSNDPEMLVNFTGSVEEVQNRLFYRRAGGRTALLDGLYLSLTAMKQANNPKKALLLISDGGDNHSRYNVKDVKTFVREADVQIYAIGIFDPIGSRDAPELVWGPTLLSEIAEMTGGRLFPVGIQNLSELPDISSKISLELRNQYVLGYRPTNRKRDGTWRKIKVKLNPPRGLPPLNTYARSGYYAPAH
ncbi:MAG: VWA domain-containing protein [Terriglobia bacterium]